MWSIHRILVAIKDPMACSLPAVAKATQLAHAFNADLELFHAIDSSVYVDMAGCDEDRALQTENDERMQYVQRLERIASRLRLHTKKVTVAAEWDFPSYEAILRRAECTGADLIVAECHAGPRLASAFRRLSDGELVRLSPVPVLLVRGSRPYHRPTILTAVDPSRAFAKPRGLDEEILRVGASLSNALRGHLHAVHAYVPTRASDLARATAAGLPVTDVRPIEAKVRFDRLLKGATVLPQHRHLIGGHPSEGVRNLARRLKAEIVVAGAVSRAGLQRLLIGNTAERLLNSLPCDLLVVKPAGFSNRVATESHGPRGRFTRASVLTGAPPFERRQAPVRSRRPSFRRLPTSFEARRRAIILGAPTPRSETLAARKHSSQHVGYLRGTGPQRARCRARCDDHHR